MSSFVLNSISRRTNINHDEMLRNDHYQHSKQTKKKRYISSWWSHYLVTSIKISSIEIELLFFSMKIFVFDMIDRWILDHERENRAASIWQLDLLFVSDEKMWCWEKTRYWAEFNSSILDFVQLIMASKILKAVGRNFWKMKSLDWF